MKKAEEYATSFNRLSENNLTFFPEESILFKCLSEIEVWLSLVERCVRDAEAAGSSPVTSTRNLFCLYGKRGFILKVCNVCFHKSR